MAYNYDKLYASTPNALGDPAQVYVDFFAAYHHANARVLDIGCGQGRDALFIARRGHHVTGVDLSPNGINNMTAAAAAEGLQITGIVADIARFTPTGMFDVVVIDRTLHMLAFEQRHATLALLLKFVTPDGWLLIEDEKSNIAGLQSVIVADKAEWETVKASRGTLFVHRRA